MSDKPFKLPLIQSAMQTAESEFLKLVNQADTNQPPAPTAGSVEEFFGPVIHAYTRAQALADGFQVDVSATAAEAGIRFPVYLTRRVYDTCVLVPPSVSCQDEAGRLWDIVWMTRFAITRSQPGADRLEVKLYVRNDDTRSKLVKLVAVCGPVDIDNPPPAITIMFPDED